MRSLAMPSLQDLANDAAAGPTLQEYLESRSIKTSATLALLASDEESLDRTLVQPLFQGWAKADGTTLTVPENEKPIAKAMLLHMWQLARQAWKQNIGGHNTSGTDESAYHFCHDSLNSYLR